VRASLPGNSKQRVETMKALSIRTASNEQNSVRKRKLIDENQADIFPNGKSGSTSG
jgi:hypothetical protein